MFKIECECGASNVIEEGEHLTAGDVEIDTGRNGTIVITCCHCTNRIVSEEP